MTSSKEKQKHSAIFMGYALLASLILLGLAPSIVEGNHPNEGFESGDFTGWTRIGTANTMGSSSGLVSWGEWVREVDTTYAQVGSYGARFRCEESGAPASDPWYCQAGKRTEFTSATGMGVWFRLVEDPSYWAADLMIDVSDGTGLIHWVFDPSFPNWACDNRPAHQVECEQLSMGVWHWRCLDIPEFFERAHGRPISTPFQVSMRTYADETASEVWIDHTTHEKCAPEADFDWLPQPVCALQETTFYDFSSPSAGATLTQSHWDFGDGNTHTANPWTATVTHTYLLPGTYTVTLTVTDSSGKQDTTSRTVLVALCPPGIPPHLGCGISGWWSTAGAIPTITVHGHLGDSGTSNPPCGPTSPYGSGYPFFSNAASCLGIPPNTAVPGAYCGAFLPPGGTATCSLTTFSSNPFAGFVAGLDVNGDGIIDTSLGDLSSEFPVPSGTWIKDFGAFAPPGRLIVFPIIVGGGSPDSAMAAIGCI